MNALRLTPPAAVRLTIQRLVRAGDPAFQRRRQTWEVVGNKFAYDGVPGTPIWYDGTQHPWEIPACLAAANRR